MWLGLGALSLGALGLGADGLLAACGSLAGRDFSTGLLAACDSGARGLLSACELGCAFDVLAGRFSLVRVELVRLDGLAPLFSLSARLLFVALVFCEADGRLAFSSLEGDFGAADFEADFGVSVRLPPGPEARASLGEIFGA